LLLACLSFLFLYDSVLEKCIWLGICPFLLSCQIHCHVVVLLSPIFFLVHKLVCFVYLSNEMCFICLLYILKSLFHVVLFDLYSFIPSTDFGFSSYFSSSLKCSGCLSHIFVFFLMLVLIFKNFSLKTFTAWAVKSEVICYK
jgi:hypothetical protein